MCLPKVSLVAAICVIAVPPGILSFACQTATAAKQPVQHTSASSRSAADDSTPGPQDVPEPVPGSLGLAGDSRPDVARFLNVRSVSMTSLSPDGRRAAYITDTTGVPQVWVADTKGGPSLQLTYAEGGVSPWGPVEWSPSGEWIAYAADTAGDERQGFYLVSPDGLQERELQAPSAAFREWGRWSPDGRHVAFGSTERNGLDFDIYVQDIGADGRGADPRRVLEGRGYLSVAAWRPDGEALLLTEARGESDRNVYLLDMRTGRQETLCKPDDAASYAGFAWTPDSRGFYVATNQDRDLAGVAYYDVASRALRWVETPDAEVETVALSRDGRHLAWVVNRNGYAELGLRDLRSGKLGRTPRQLPVGVYVNALFAPRASVLGVLVAGPTVPGDVYTVDPRTARSQRVTFSAAGGLDPRKFVVPEAVSFKSWDGTTIYGLLYLPPQAENTARPPLLLNVHGGPTGQARPMYDAPMQYLLTRGIAVFDLNFRGSTGYGKRFTRLDNKRLRPNSVKDMAGALDWLATMGKVDAGRAAVMGASYGGYMTFAAMTQLPGRFRAGIGLVGVSNWVTALEGASPQLRASDRIEYGNIDDPEDRKFFVELSPISYIRNVRAPLMVLHGANDPRDPPTEADQLVRAIRAQGGQVEYLRFPDEGHVMRKLSNRITAYRRIAAFLEKQIASPTSAP